MVIRSKTFWESYYEESKLFQTLWIKFWMGLFLLFLAVLPLLGDSYWVYMVNLACVSTVGAVGLNILTGFTGQISLGHAGFFAIGAYATAILSSSYNMPIWICLPASAVFSGIAGFLIGFPCLRLKGLYLAMATMAFGVGIVWALINFERLTNGVRGIFVHSVNLFGYTLDSTNKQYYLFIIVTALSIIAASNLMRTHVGRAFLAIRDRDIAAQVIGIDLTKYKVLSFTISSLYAGIAGGLYSYLMGHINPEGFTFLISIQFLAMIIVGGLGSILGSIFGAVFVTITPELIKTFFRPLALLIPYIKYSEEWNVAVFGLLIMLFLIFEPKGLSGIWRRIKVSFKNWPYTY